MLIVASLFVLSGCATSASGLKPDAELSSLSDDDWQALCEWSVAQYGKEEYKCDGYSVSGGTVEECLAESDVYAACDLTVEDLEECLAAIAEDPCDSTGWISCAGVFACALGK